jgi:hypothetical protein
MVLAFALAGAAERIGGAVGLQDLGYLAAQGAIAGLLYLDDGLGLTGLIIDGLPAPRRRFGGEGQRGNASNRAVNSERMVSPARE